MGSNSIMKNKNNNTSSKQANQGNQTHQINVNQSYTENKTNYSPHFNTINNLESGALGMVTLSFDLFEFFKPK